MTKGTAKTAALHQQQKTTIQRSGKVWNEDASTISKLMKGGLSIKSNEFGILKTMSIRMATLINPAILLFSLILLLHLMLSTITKKHSFIIVFRSKTNFFRNITESYPVMKFASLRNTSHNSTTSSTTHSIEYFTELEEIYSRLLPKISIRRKNLSLSKTSSSSPLSSLAILLKISKQALALEYYLQPLNTQISNRLVDRNTAHHTEHVVQDDEIVEETEPRDADAIQQWQSKQQHDRQQIEYSNEVTGGIHVLVSKLQTHRQQILNRLLDKMNDYSCVLLIRDDSDQVDKLNCTAISHRKLRSIDNEGTFRKLIPTPSPKPSSSTFEPTISMIPTYTEKCYVCKTNEQMIENQYKQFDFMGYQTSCGEIEYVGKHGYLPPYVCSIAIETVEEHCSCISVALYYKPSTKPSSLESRQPALAPTSLMQNSSAPSLRPRPQTSAAMSKAPISSSPSILSVSESLPPSLAPTLQPSVTSASPSIPNLPSMVPISPSVPNDSEVISQSPSIQYSFVPSPEESYHPTIRPSLVPSRNPTLRSSLIPSSSTDDSNKCYVCQNNSTLRVSRYNTQVVQMLNTSVSCSFLYKAGIEGFLQFFDICMAATTLVTSGCKCLSTHEVDDKIKDDAVIGTQNETISNESTYIASKPTANYHIPTPTHVEKNIFNKTNPSTNKSPPPTPWNDDTYLECLNRKNDAGKSQTTIVNKNILIETSISDPCIKIPITLFPTTFSSIVATDSTSMVETVNVISLDTLSPTIVLDISPPSIAQSSLMTMNDEPTKSISPTMIPRKSSWNNSPNTSSTSFPSLMIEVTNGNSTMSNTNTIPSTPSTKLPLPPTGIDGEQMKNESSIQPITSSAFRISFGGIFYSCSPLFRFKNEFLYLIISSSIGFVSLNI